MKHIIRIILYLVGFFTLAIGINLAIFSNLGVSPVSSFPLAISLISGLSLGIITTIVYFFFIVIQIALLRKKFKPKSLLQIFFSFVFGFFVDITSHMLAWVNVYNYFGQIFLLLLSSVFVAIGLTLIITMDIVPNAPEGLILAISEVTSVPFSKMKVWFDCALVILAVGLALTFMGDISFIREGTIISALLIGKILGVVMKISKPKLISLAFYQKAELPPGVSQAN